METETQRYFSLFITTTRRTKTGVILSFLLSYLVNINFESYTAPTLNDILRLFYASVRSTKEGGEYSVASLRSLRAGIQRHLSGVNIISDTVFKTSNAKVSTRRLLWAGPSQSPGPFFSPSPCLHGAITLLNNNFRKWKRRGGGQGESLLMVSAPQNSVFSGECFSRGERRATVLRPTDILKVCLIHFNNISGNCVSLIKKKMAYMSPLKKRLELTIAWWVTVAADPCSCQWRSGWSVFTRSKETECSFN